MKLIIDIDEETYIKAQAGILGSFGEIIANGKPYEERPQSEFVELLKDRIENSVCKHCQMNKHCELCEISRVFMIIDLTDIDMNGDAK